MLRNQRRSRLAKTVTAAMYVGSILSSPQTAVAAPAVMPALTVTVAGVRSALGTIIVSLCRAGESFPGGCSMQRSAPATKGATRVSFATLPPGHYAVALFHDEDGDGKLTFIKEGIGFSNDANIAYGPPKLSLSDFVVGSTPKSIVVNIKYLS